MPEPESRLGDHHRGGSRSGSGASESCTRLAPAQSTGRSAEADTAARFCVLRIRAGPWCIPFSSRRSRSSRAAALILIDADRLGASSREDIQRVLAPTAAPWLNGTALASSRAPWLTARHYPHWLGDEGLPAVRDQKFNRHAVFAGKLPGMSRQFYGSHVSRHFLGQMKVKLG